MELLHTYFAPDGPGFGGPGGPGGPGSPGQPAPLGRKGLLPIYRQQLGHLNGPRQHDVVAAGGRQGGLQLLKSAHRSRCRRQGSLCSQGGSPCAETETCRRQDRQGAQS